MKFIAGGVLTHQAQPDEDLLGRAYWWVFEVVLARFLQPDPLVRERIVGPHPDFGGERSAFEAFTSLEVGRVLFERPKEPNRWKRHPLMNFVGRIPIRSVSTPKLLHC